MYVYDCFALFDTDLQFDQSLHCLLFYHNNILGSQMDMFKYKYKPL